MWRWRPTWTSHGRFRLRRVGQQALRSTSPSYLTPPPPTPHRPTLGLQLGFSPSVGTAQPAQEQKTLVSDGTPHHSSPPRSTPKQTSPGVPTDIPQGEEMTLPTTQATSSLREDDAPQFPLTVYHSRRRYRSTPAATRDTRSWLTRHEEHQREMVRSPSQVDDPSLPSAPQGLPGTRDPGHHDPRISTVIGDITSGRSTLTPMKCITWNVRGLRSPRCRGVVGRYLKEWGADVICLQETMLASTDHRTWSDLGWGGEATQVCIEANGRSGGVLLAWKASSFDQEMTWRGRHTVAARLLCHLVIASAYGPAILTNWGELWEDLLQLYRAFPNMPLLIGGDFNVSLDAEDRPNDMGGSDPGSARFKEVLAQLGLGELGPGDRRFTWRRPTSQSRIDRFLYSPELSDIYTLAEVTSLPRPLSDHTPLLWTSQVGSARPTYFKMDHSWFIQDGFKEDILRWWTAHNDSGPTASRLATKLLKLRHYLFETRRQIRIDRNQRRDAALNHIQTMDALEDIRSLGPGEIQTRRAARDEVTELDLRHEIDWRQRSRQLWLAAGDANTRFFHQVAKGRKRQNHIWRIRIGDRVYTDHASIGQALADHFRAFYCRGPPNKWNWTPTTISTISLTQRQHLSRPFSLEEVQAVVWSLNGEGALGPDGIPVYFYKVYWDVLGPKVMRVMGDFHAGRCQMERLNKVYLVLIPKILRAEQIGDFRPIALSNSIYLIIAKVLANRLREVMDSLISPLQSAFIPGQQMIDNIVMAEEIVAAWRRSGTVGFLWKVDFAKAYDSIDWRYLWNVLRRRDFSEEWVRWMKLCVTTSSCSILINDRMQGGWFQPQCGIRQGCPLAPLLFILASDALAFCTTRLCSRGHLSGFRTAGHPGGIPLLQYANDTTFFIQGLETAARTLSQMMDIFADFSGLQLNRAKSSFVGFGLTTEAIRRCAEILATPIETLPIRYLGLPLTDHRLRTQD